MLLIFFSRGFTFSFILCFNVSFLKRFKEPFLKLFYCLFSSMFSPISQTQRQRKRGTLNLKGFKFIIRFDQLTKGSPRFLPPFLN